MNWRRRANNITRWWSELQLVNELMPITLRSPAHYIKGGSIGARGCEFFICLTRFGGKRIRLYFLRDMDTGWVDTNTKRMNALRRDMPTRIWEYIREVARVLVAKQIADAMASFPEALPDDLRRVVVSYLL